MIKNIDIKKMMWYVLFVISTIGVILMISSTYSSSDEQILSLGRRTVAWHERLIFPFYFTFISNVMGTITSLLMIVCKKTNVKWMRRLQIYMAVNLLLTFIVYWATLFPVTKPNTSLGWSSNMFVHLFTPLISIIAFFVETFKNKAIIKYKNVWKESLWHLLFLVGWAIIAFVIYFALGANKSAAIYHFLDVKNNSVLSTVIYIIAVPSAYYLFTVLAMWVSNPKK